MPPFLKIFFGTLLFGVCFGLAFTPFLLKMDRDFSRMIAEIPVQDTKIFDRNGSLIWEISLPDRGFQTFVPLSKIPKTLQEAAILTEDRYFYHHLGFWPPSIVRAALVNLLKGKWAQGGSTITQQLSRNLLAQASEKQAPRTFRQKIREGLLTLFLEWHYSKDWILERYLNIIFYGNNAYGIETASWRYFSKHVWELSKEEQKLLVSLPKAPTFLNPLRRPFKTPVALYPFQSEEETAPHFVREVLHRLHPPPGAEIRTTLDMGLQKKVQEILDRRLEEKIPNNSYVSGAVVVLDVKNGDCLAMVGSRHFWSPHGGQVNGAMALRHPGSALKPFTYFAAFEKGWDPALAIPDEPHHFLTAKGIPYTPQNFDRRYHGWVSAREALANSLNVPAVLALNYVGLENYMEVLKKFGLHSFDQPAEYYGLALTLGGGAVRLIDLTNAYAALARGGAFLPWRFTPDPLPQAVPVAGERSAPLAYLVTSILSDKEARRKAFGETSALELSSQSAAVKTGTSHSYRDKWTVGYTPEFVVGVWVGRPDNGALPGLTGVSTAAPIWHDVMEVLYAGRPVVAFKKPKGITEKQICFDAPCQILKEEIFLEEADFIKNAVSKPAPSGGFLVVSPRPYDVFEREPSLSREHQKIPFELRFLSSPENGMPKKTDWYLDGKKIQTTMGLSHKFFYPVAEGKHRLTVKIENRNREKIPFDVQ
ncbi:MAG: transglycosylase domain-containing protein [Deltaproteobacteria bacterium]|nr:transglycosylase domain-containing protein [Deltaproteobacteria bacterium]